MNNKGLFTLLAIIIISGCSSLETGRKARDSNTNSQTTSDMQNVQPADMRVRSTFNKTSTWNRGQKFWNVIGSTDDPKIDNKSWIAVYREKCGVDPGHISATGATCPQNALGGHVVKNGQSQDPKKNSSVYIVPICTSENNNPNIEMTVASNTICVAELNYWAK